MLCEHGSFDLEGNGLGLLYLNLEVEISSTRVEIVIQLVGFRMVTTLLARLIDHRLDFRQQRLRVTPNQCRYEILLLQSRRQTSIQSEARMHR